MVAVLGSVQYTFGALNHKQFFLRCLKEDDIITGTLAFEVDIGSKWREKHDVNVRFSMLPTRYQAKYGMTHMLMTRIKTNYWHSLVRMQLSRIMGSNFNLDVASGESDVKEKHGLKGLV